MTESASSAKPIVAIGEILIDLIVQPGQSLVNADRLAVREGGAPMNAAIAMARLGLPVKFCGVVGDDAFGQRLRTLLEVERIDTSSLRSTNAASTSLALAWKDERGDGHFQLLRLADRYLSVTDIEKAGIGETAAILVGSVALAEEPSREAVIDAIDRAIAANVPVIVDVNVRPTLWSNREALLSAAAPMLAAAHVLKLSLDDAAYLWGIQTAEEAIAAAAHLNPWLTFVTDGSRGVAVADRETGLIRTFPVLKVEAIDPTGAGDAFTGALISQLVASDWKLPTDNDVRIAMAAGAMATTRQGAIDALPTRTELNDFLAMHDTSLSA